ncbi:MAG TPA: serine acetyltransferase [Acidobacteriaceae bacterium]|jgi:serine O-acetyltransferase|nr:serine acetyltransferase [Acidobacteriaceae bacterium]
MGKFSEDLARYRQKGYRGKELWLEPTVWSIGSYRLGNWLHMRRPTAIVRIPLKVISFFLLKFCLVFMEMDIDAQATIGGGLYIGHIGGVHINQGAVLGRNCDLAHRITIGASAMGRSGIPVLGDEVYIGTGAVLLGKIRVGDGAKIAANTLVMTNVPAGATVMGVPGRIVMRPQVKTAEPATTAQPAAETVETMDVE